MTNDSSNTPENRSLSRPPITEDAGKTKKNGSTWRFWRSSDGEYYAEADNVPRHALTIIAGLLVVAGLVVGGAWYYIG